jgi:hypothetical protein
MEVIIFIKNIFGRNNGISNFMVMENCLSAGNSPYIGTIDVVVIDKIYIDDFGNFLRHPERKAGIFPGVKPEETHFFFMAAIEEVFIPGHVFRGG